jgi:hypothetical protein
MPKGMTLNTQACIRRLWHFALAALSGVAAVVGLKFGSSVGIGLTGLSVMAILYSSTQLIREARRSLKVIEQHLES